MRLETKSLHLMYCEIDAKSFKYEKFEKIAKVCKALDGKVIRLYVPPTDASKKPKSKRYDDSKIDASFYKNEFLESAERIKKLIPLL